MIDPNECLLWDRGVDSSGYGSVWDPARKRKIGVHRLVWEEENGPIPEGMQVLHRCDTPPCINVDHLFLGTQRDNIADMDAKGRRRNGELNAGKTHCPAGHPYGGDNLYLDPRGGRQCKACRREQFQAHRERRRYS